MTNVSKRSQKSGKNDSESMTTTENASGIVTLRSLLDGGGDHPGTGLSIPKAGVIFEADAARAAELVSCGLAAIADESAKGE